MQNTNTLYDPESLLTGSEVEQGLDYDNSCRVWPSEAMRQRAERGDIPVSQIPLIAPRKRVFPDSLPVAADGCYDDPCEGGL